jgi:hypothetical protein
MKDDTERIERGMAGAKADREPSRLAARGTLQPLGNPQALPMPRMLRPGTGRGPTEDKGQAPSARSSAIVNCKS